MNRLITLVSDNSFAGHVTIAHGYASVLRQMGCTVEHHSISPEAELQKITDTIPRDSVLVQCLIPPLLSPVEGLINIAIVFHEWSRMPDPWIARLSGFERIWVASRYNADVLRQSGFIGTLDIIPPLIEPDRFSAKTGWKAGDPFRFLTVGEWHFRKGYHLLLEAFQRAFRVESVELHIKTSATATLETGDQRIVLLGKRLSEMELNGLYSRYDAYVTTSLAEGLGLPVGEAMAAGLPVAAVNWGGLTEFCGEGRSLDIPYHIGDQPFCSRPEYYAPGQQCAIAEIEGASAILKAMYSMSETGRQQLAERARKHIKKRFSLAKGMSALEPVLRSLAQERRE